MLCLLLLSVLLICIFIITTTSIFWFYSICYWVLYIVLPLTYIVSPLWKKGEKELIPSYQQISRSTIFSFPWEHVYIFIIQSHASRITVRNSWRFQILTYQITYYYRRIICNVSAQNKRIKVTSRNRDTFKSTDMFMTYTP